LNNISGNAEKLKQNNGTLTVTHMRRSTNVIWWSRAFYLIRGNQRFRATHSEFRFYSNSI